MGQMCYWASLSKSWAHLRFHAFWASTLIELDSKWNAS